MKKNEIILQAISKCYPLEYSAIEYLFDQCQSYDKTIEAIEFIQANAIDYMVYQVKEDAKNHKDILK